MNFIYFLFVLLVYFLNFNNIHLYLSANLLMIITLSNDQFYSMMLYIVNIQNNFK
jgi:hypothetical protein